MSSDAKPRLVGRQPPARVGAPGEDQATAAGG